jgi:hypothetical protein
MPSQSVTNPAQFDEQRQLAAYKSLAEPLNTKIDQLNAPRKEISGLFGRTL